MGWRHSAYSNERFPLRPYASALRGSGPDADEVLAIAVTWRNPKDGNGDRLVVAADILGEEGLILAESPTFEAPIPDQSAVLKTPNQVLRDVTNRVRGAMVEIGKWLDSQTPTIREALAAAA